jgi:hypothetical protein
MSGSEVANPLLAEMYWRAVIIAELEKDLARFPKLTEQEREIYQRAIFIVKGKK